MCLFLSLSLSLSFSLSFSLCMCVRVCIESERERDLVIPNTHRIQTVYIYVVLPLNTHTLTHRDLVMPKNKAGKHEDVYIVTELLDTDLSKVLLMCC